MSFGLIEVLKFIKKKKKGIRLLSTIRSQNKHKYSLNNVRHRQDKQLIGKRSDTTGSSALCPSGDNEG